MLSAEHLDVSYGSRLVLKQIDLQLPAGEVLGVIGPNGAGKSTLVRALSGILPLNSGQVRVNGQNILQLSPLERARQIAVVSQIGSLPPAFSGWEVVLLGRTPHLNWLGQATRHDRDIAVEAMQFTETTHLAGRRVGGLDPRPGEGHPVDQQGPVDRVPVEAREVVAVGHGEFPLGQVDGGRLHR